MEREWECGTGRFSRLRLGPIQRSQDLAELGDADFRPREFGKEPVGLFDRDRLRIVGASKSLLHGAVFWMLLVAQGLQEILVTRNAAAVLWGTGTTTLHADRPIYEGRTSVGEGFEGEEVVPAVPEVVLVDENRGLGLGDLFDGDRLLVRDRRISLELVQIERRVGDDDVAEGELMQVAVRPPHGNLDHGVYPSEVGGVGDDEGTPGGGLDVLQLDVHDAMVSISKMLSNCARVIYVDNGQPAAFDHWIPSIGGGSPAVDDSAGEHYPSPWHSENDSGADNHDQGEPGKVLKLEVSRVGAKMRHGARPYRTGRSPKWHERQSLRSTSDAAGFTRTPEIGILCSAKRVRRHIDKDSTTL